MRATRHLDRLYAEQCKEAKLDRLMLQVFGGPEGLRAASAILKAQRTLRFAQGRATKFDRLARDWERRRATECTTQGDS